MAIRKRRPAPPVSSVTARRKKPSAAVPAKFLLDTHAFLWFVSGNDKLSSAAEQLIADPENTIYVSAASVWEITIKRQIGKLPDTVQFTPSLAGYLQRRGFTELSMTVMHAEAAGALPELHRDPFDRMLIAQAQLDGLTLVSNETLFDAYGVRRVW